jgi:hypothetical protein
MTQSPATLYRPTRIAPGNGRHMIGDGWVFRVRLRRGKRQHIFLPAVVLTIARDRHNRRQLRADRVAAAAAAAHPFWKDLPIGALGLGDRGVVRRRYRPTGLHDFDAVAVLMDDRLDRARQNSRAPALQGVAHRKLFGYLTPLRRARLAAALATLELPATGMHGDLHLFNFVGDGESFRAIDWEHFDPLGSFVYDYVDFFVAARMIEAGEEWHRLLGRLAPDDPEVQTIVDRLDVDPIRLVAYYLFLKVDILLTHRQAHRLPLRPDVAPLVELVDRAVDALGPAPDLLAGVTPARAASA